MWYCVEMPTYQPLCPTWTISHSETIKWSISNPHILLSFKAHLYILRYWKLHAHLIMCHVVHMGHGGWPHYVGYYQPIYFGEFFYSLNNTELIIMLFIYEKITWDMSQISCSFVLLSLFLWPIMHFESFSDMCWADSFENEGSTNRSKSKEKNCWSS